MQLTDEQDSSASRCAVDRRRDQPARRRVGRGAVLPGARGVQEARRFGLLGISKPTEFGGSGLDHSYQVAMGEELGHIPHGAIPMAIGVQTDMCTPALAKHGSDELRREFLAPRSPATWSAASE